MALMKVAVRNLRRNRRRSAITLAALVVGVGCMVAIKGFVGGMQAMILENQMRGSLGALQVHKAGYLANVLGAPLTIDMADTPELRAAIASVPGVAVVSPRIDFGAQLSMPDKKPPPEDGSDLPEADKGATSFLMMTAFDPALEQRVTPKRWEWTAQGRGEMFGTLDEPRVVLNDDFAVGIEAPLHPKGAPLPEDVMQMVALLAPDRDASLNGENVVIGGAFPSATPNDRRQGFVPLGLAQRVLRMEGRVTEYGLALTPGADLEAVKALLQQKLGPEYEVHTWEERIPFIKDLVTTQDFIFGVVTNIFLFVVLLGIVNAMLMSVMERVREIGTMLAVGARRLQVAQLFLLEGAVIGLIGGLLGCALGLAWVVWAHRHGLPIPAPGAKLASIIRPTVDAAYLFQALAQATIGASLAALWPAWRASKLRPVEALASV